MLVHLLPYLNTKRVILASGSPRRKEILCNLGLKIEVIPSTFPENLDKKLFDPIGYVVENAKQKSLQVAEGLENDPPELLIGADTVVVVDGRILEKPANSEAAFGMLRDLSGRSHYVVTGVTLIQWKDSIKNITTFSEKTTVTFAQLTDREIQAYIDLGEPFDKAGGYGIQSVGGSFVQSLSGDYFNVVGFPVHNFCCHVADLYPNGN